MKIKQTKEEIVKGKFIRTIAAIESVHNEATADMQISQSWSAETVANRIDAISSNFYKELKQLTQDLED